MSKRFELAGQHFGHWEVLSKADNRGARTYWHCRCGLCGVEWEVQTVGLTGGGSTRCKPCANKDKTYHYTRGDKLRYLYAVRSGEYVKFGTTDDVQRRVKTMAVDNPHSIELIWQEKNEEGLEKSYHDLYKHRHHHGEWYLFQQKDDTL